MIKILTLPTILLMVCCGMAQDLSQLRLIGQPEKSENEFVSASTRDANGRTCMAVQVISDMEGFKYDSYNGVVKVDDQPGQDMVYLSPDETVLQILHSGYEPLKLYFSESGIIPAERRIWKIKVGGDKKASEVSIAIVTTPSGAEVFIDGISRGRSEQFVVATGKHDLRLVKNGYTTIEKEIFADEKNTYFKITLPPQEDVNLQIDSAPQGAVVYLDGVKLAGKTLINVFYAPGSYKIRLEKEWYLPLEETIEIAPGMGRKLYKLMPDFGTLTVTSAPQTDLTIFLNNGPQNVKTPHSFEQLTAGTYRVRARSDFYETDEVEIALARGERKTAALTSSASFATLTVKTLPGAKIFLNGQKLEQMENIRLEPAIVTLRAEMNKASPIEEKVILKKGEVRVVELMPVVPVGTIQVAAVPLEAQIELRGDAGEFYNAVGAQSFSNIPAGSYLVEVKMPGYTSYKETVALKNGEKINRSVTLEKSAVAQPIAGQPVAARPQPPASGSAWRDPKTGIEFVLVKGGTFEMGDVFGEGENDEKPVHTVAVGDFYLGKTEVTVGQYRAFCQAIGSSMPDAPSWGWQEDDPIVNVNWIDAIAFCNWAGYRLPTEAEWEYAAREGGRKVRFGNGRDVADPAEMNFDGRKSYKKSYSRAGKYRGRTTAAGSFAASSLGLSDMSGNVREWCLDRYASNYYGQSPRDNPRGPSSGDTRVLRGGSWDNNPLYCRVADRVGGVPNGRADFVGFRVARPAH